MLINSAEQVKQLRGKIHESSDRTVDSLREVLASGESSMDILWKLKFEQVGWHYFEGRPMNLFGQLNDMFSWLVALRAVELLFEVHGEVEEYDVKAGSAGRKLDIVSVPPGTVAAEVFAQIGPHDGKLKCDLDKVAKSDAQHKYVFFYSLGFQEGRQESLERAGVEVWAVRI